jgi:hypothetical protein
VISSDIALYHDHLFFAVEQAGAIDLAVFNGATTTPALLRQVALGNDPRVPALTDVQDGEIAVAASGSRVAVAWATRKSLGPNDAVGGYAIFACTSP